MWPGASTCDLYDCFWFYVSETTEDSNALKFLSYPMQLSPSMPGNPREQLPGLLGFRFFKKKKKVRSWHMLPSRLTLQLRGMMLGYTDWTPVNQRFSVVTGNTNTQPAAWITGM